MAYSRGLYVRLIMAPNTLIGTIEDTKFERGQVHYLFRQDGRVVIEGGTPDVRVLEDEVEPCQRPTDADVRVINELIRRGS